ncbi:hypothetical protein [Luteolibacter soli]|uniref:Uncharacterized protein n=1 Tax=Luteolibacter soli TaxID=3135280 RepID=A0ABU9AV66_9BACT
MKLIFSALLLLLSPVAIGGEKELPVSVADSGSKAVDELVAGLVSRRPAPAPTSTEEPKELGQEGGLGLVSMSGRYATAEVEASIRKLQELGPSAFPHLLKHLDDDRYSYSDQPFVSGINGQGWMNHSVGEAIHEFVLTNDLAWVSGYKLRENAEGKAHHPLRIEDYIKIRGGMEAWVEAVKDRSRASVFTEFIDWCIAEEKKRGFEDKEDEEFILGRYLKKRKEIEDGSGKE